MAQGLAGMAHALSGGDYWELRARSGDVQRAEQIVRQAMAAYEQAQAVQRACIVKLAGVYGFDPALADYALDDATLTLRYQEPEKATDG